MLWLKPIQILLSYFLQYLRPRFSILSPYDLVSFLLKETPKLRLNALPLHHTSNILFAVLGHLVDTCLNVRWLLVSCFWFWDKWFFNLVYLGLVISHLVLNRSLSWDYAIIVAKVITQYLFGLLWIISFAIKFMFLTGSQLISGVDRTNLRQVLHQFLVLGVLTITWNVKIVVNAVDELLGQKWSLLFVQLCTSSFLLRDFLCSILLQLLWIFQKHYMLWVYLLKNSLLRFGTNWLLPLLHHLDMLSYLVAKFPLLNIKL